MDSKYIQLINSIQEKAVTWLSQCRDIKYSRFYDGIQSLIRKESLLMDLGNSGNLFYRIVFPLVKVGIIEYGIDSSGNVFFFLPDDSNSVIPRIQSRKSRYDISNIDYELAKRVGLGLLKRLPSVTQYVESLEEAPYVSLKYYYDEYSHELKFLRKDFNYEIGIYKEKDYPFFPFFLTDSKKRIHKIRSYRNSLDENDYAHCYNQATRCSELYSYSKETKQLTFRFQSSIPFLLLRAMCLISPKVLSDDKVYIGERVSFCVENKEVIDEIDRILKVEL